jgi:hypothetical protein
VIRLAIVFLCVMIVFPVAPVAPVAIVFPVVFLCVMIVFPVAPVAPVAIVFPVVFPRVGITIVFFQNVLVGGHIADNGHCFTPLEDVSFLVEGITMSFLSQN